MHTNVGSLLAPLWPSLLQPEGLGSTMLRGVPLRIYKGSVALIMSGVYLVSRKDDLIDWSKTIRGGKMSKEYQG